MASLRSLSLSQLEAPTPLRTALGKRLNSEFAGVDEGIVHPWYDGRPRLETYPEESTVSLQAMHLNQRSV